MEAPTIESTHYHLPNQKKRYQGKVRDVYNIAHDYLVMVATDRISAFDTILPRPIPYKGQILNQIAARSLAATSDIVRNWVIDVPDPNVTIGLNCKPIPVEMVIRGYLAGHAWRVYEAGNREICGQTLPDGLQQHDPLPTPIITPTTKAHTGHDKDISKKEIIKQGIVKEKTYEELAHYTKELFKRGSERAREKGLLLVDTKYEFGWFDEEIYLIDEVHTPDSSRYFYASGYEERQNEGQPQRQLSKEFVREWLMDQGFQGKKGQSMPELTDEVVLSISKRYQELFEQVTGESFYPPSSSTDPVKRIENHILQALQNLS